MGAAVLSAGGGSFPYLEYLAALEILEKRPAVPLRSVETLGSGMGVALVAMVGAPLPMIERIADPGHFARPVQLLERHLGIRFQAIMGYEIGSMNGMLPAMVALQMGLPLVDADTTGRSFPEVQMSAFAIDGIDMAPIAVSDVRGNDLLITNVANGRWLEQLLRPIATTCGSVIAISGTHSVEQITNHAYLGTYSRAIRIGAAILQAQSMERDPVEQLLASEPGEILVRGKLSDVDRQVRDGFVRGQASIHALEGQQCGSIHFQNEYTLVEIARRRRAVVPDLIVVFDSERGEPLGTEALRYGQRVTVVRLPPLSRHLSKRSLEAIGPRAFGYDFDYTSEHA